MGAELGATTSIFPSDEVTKQFLEAQGRGEVWSEQKADPDAVYDEELHIDLSELVPLAACPHSPDNVKTVAEIGKLKMIKPETLDTCQKPIKCVTQEDKRFFYCNCKTLNLMPSVLYAEKAYKAGADETILYRHDGRITECAHCNCHILKDGILYTAPTDDLILPGIARAHLVRMCKKLGIGVSETPYYLEDLRNADEIIVTSSSHVCMYVDELDGKPVGGKDRETLFRLRDALYEEICKATE